MIDHIGTLRQIASDVSGIGGGVMRGTDDATLRATWTDAMAIALANYTAVRAGYLDQLDFDLQEAISIDHVSANPAYMHNPLVDQADIVVAQVGLIRNRPSSAPIQIAEITTPGLIKVWRYRKGVDAGWTLIVAGGGMGAGIGSIYYSYTFPSASWADGDLILYEIYNTVVTLNTKVYTLSTVQGFGVIGDTTQTAAILADTNELQGDWANGGRLDLLLDAITAVGPTKAEMDIAHGLLATEAKQDIIDTNVDQIEVLVDSRVMGRTQVAVRNIDLHVAAGAYVLFTPTTQDVIAENLTVRVPVDMSGAGGFTGITIETATGASFQTFIDSTAGAKANMTTEAQLSWSGSILCKVLGGWYIVVNVLGDDPGTDSDIEVVVTYRAVVSGGYLDPTPV